MAFTYNDTPQATQFIDQTQPLIQDNFQSINSLIAVDHEAFSATKAGYHRAIHIVAGALTPALAAGEVGLYVSSNDLFVKKGTATAVNLTAAVTDESAGDVTVRRYTMPNGLIARFGRTTGTKLEGGKATPVTFPVPFGTTCYSVVLTPIVSGNSRANTMYIQSFNASGFTVYNRRGNGGIDADCTFYAVGI